jgi:amino acid transporter
MLSRIKKWLLGAPRDVRNPHTFHRLSLATVFAWIGLGADGLSSSAYGPEQAFRHLGDHTGLAAVLAVFTALTVVVISYTYARIVEEFPSGGGGYVVAKRLLGDGWALVSGAALVTDYVLTITVSVASGASTLFSFLPPAWVPSKLPFEVTMLGVLIILNLRGIKESIAVLAPVFAVFVATHAFVIFGTIGQHVPDLPAVGHEVERSIAGTVATLGALGTVKLFVRAYALGGGTYTGIEAVSNGVGAMREPRIQTAKHTMALMAASLAFTAGGILIAYLLVHATPEEGKTMNAVLFERFVDRWGWDRWPLGHAFVILCLVSEAALLFVAAQAGFVDGPRVMANMAIDSWLPHRLAALSERLTMQNGVLLMGGASVLALISTGGNVARLVIMYSINVFVTFSLSQLAMSRFWLRRRRERYPGWARRLAMHLVGFALCATILVVTVLAKFAEGGWITLLTTGVLMALCIAVRRHYATVYAALRRLDADLPALREPEAGLVLWPTEDPLAVLFVAKYGGLGRHMLLDLLTMFPGYFKRVMFVSIAVVDSEIFKGSDELTALERGTRAHLTMYERFGQSLGLETSSLLAVGTEVAVEAEKIGSALHRQHPRALFVAGQLILDDDNLWTKLLHSETAFLMQRRLEHAAVPMIVIPVRVNLESTLTG